MRWHPRNDYHGTREYAQDSPNNITFAGLRQRFNRLLRAFKSPMRPLAAAEASPEAAAPETWGQLDRWADEGGAIASPPMPRAES